MTNSTERLKVLIADDEPEMLEYISCIVARAGHLVVATAADGQELIEQHRQHSPDLIITDVRMPEVDGLEAATRCFLDRPVAIIVISAHYDPDLIERATDDHVLAYLVKPIKATDLEPAISIAIRRFREFQALHEHAESLEQAMQDRKLVERAKGLLMERSGLSEPDAFRELQLLSSRENAKMADVARRMVSTES